MPLSADRPLKSLPDTAWGPIWIAYDDMLQAVSTDGPLAGRRLAVKDNIDVAGFATTAARHSATSRNGRRQ